ncbi:hypothetical protein Tco_1427332 [Tanacetum coccineum]
MELVLEQPEVDSTDVLAPHTPCAVCQWATGDMAAGPRQRVCVNFSLCLSTSTEERKPRAFTQASLPKSDPRHTPSNVRLLVNPLRCVDRMLHIPTPTGPKAFEYKIQWVTYGWFDMVDYAQAALVRTEGKAESESSEVVCTEPCRRKNWQLHVKVEQSACVSLLVLPAMEEIKLLELAHISRAGADQDYPIDVILVPILCHPRDILNLLHWRKECPVKES